MISLRYVVCDVFTDRPLTGNQLAVFTDARRLDAETMQALAREMRFSESVFVLPAEQGGHARIRIFTPTRELPFAGHPTLGAAGVLGEPMQVSEIRLETGAGVIPVRLERDGPRVTFGWMRQPVPRQLPPVEVEPLLKALGVTESHLPVTLYDNGARHLYVALDSAEAVARLTPDLGALARLADFGVSTFAGAGTRYKTRMFAPSHGVDEDPATGSAAGPLAVHLAIHDRLGFDQELIIEQGAELQRPSQLHARVYGSKRNIEGVEVGGALVTVARGEFRLHGLR